MILVLVEVEKRIKSAAGSNEVVKDVQYGNYNNWVN